METITDTSIMPFGKHKGERMCDIPDSYLLYIYENNMCYSEKVVRDYIHDNLDAIKENLRKSK